MQKLLHTPLILITILLGSAPTTITAQETSPRCFWLTPGGWVDFSEHGFTEEQCRQMNTCDLPVIGVNACFKWADCADCAPALITNDLLACGAIPHGRVDKRIRYEKSSVPYGSQCQRETQTALCVNGQFDEFTGSFTHDDCSIIPPKNCNSDYRHGEARKRVRYRDEQVAHGTACQFETQISECNDGTFKPFTGGFRHSVCEEVDPRHPDYGIVDYTDFNKKIGMQAFRILNVDSHRELWGRSFFKTINSRPSYEDILDFESPYERLLFSAKSGCKVDTPEKKPASRAFADLTQGRCDDVSNKVPTTCITDLFLVLPCEKYLFDIPPETLKSYIDSVADYLKSNTERTYWNERDEYQIKTMKYVLNMFKTVQQGRSKQEDDANIRNHKAHFHAVLDEDSKRLDNLKSLNQKFKIMNDAFYRHVSGNTETLEQWKQEKLTGFASEKASIQGMKDFLFTAFRYENLIISTSMRKTLDFFTKPMPPWIGLNKNG